MIRKETLADQEVVDDNRKESKRYDCKGGKHKTPNMPLSTQSHVSHLKSPSNLMWYVRPLLHVDDCCSWHKLATVIVMFRSMVVMFCTLKSINGVVYQHTTVSKINRSFSLVRTNQVSTTERIRFINVNNCLYLLFWGNWSTLVRQSWRTTCTPMKNRKMGERKVLVRICCFWRVTSNDDHKSTVQKKHSKWYHHFWISKCVLHRNYWTSTSFNLSFPTCLSW